MAEDDNNHDGPLPAGGFSAWMGGMGRALDGEAPSDVPCGGCTACCRSSQFVHIGPDEVDTLAHIPPALRFPAPRMRPGNVLLGYDENGHCPMLVDDRCSIYEHRPRTCRTYDCRVFPAAGVVPDDDEQLAIAQRARRWRFDFPEEADRIRHDAVQAAATWVVEHGGFLPDGAPTNATQLAVLAVRLHDAFLGHDDETGRLVTVGPDLEAISALLAARSRPARG